MLLPGIHIQDMQMLSMVCMVLCRLNNTYCDILIFCPDSGFVQCRSYGLLHFLISKRRISYNKKPSYAEASEGNGGAYRSRMPGMLSFAYYIPEHPRKINQIENLIFFGAGDLLTASDITSVTHPLEIRYITNTQDRKK